jgi:carbon monoxide dehydrogenase subunit G
MMAAMRLRHELRYDAPLDDVLAMLTDPAYWDRVAQATDAISSTTTVEQVGADTRVRTDQEQRVVGVPSFAKKFVGESTRALKQQTWHGSTSTFEVQTPGKPTHLAGEATLAAAGGGTVLTYDLEIRASVPLVGGKLEKLVAGYTVDGFDKERAVGVAWLEGERG